MIVKITFPQNNDTETGQRAAIDIHRIKLLSI